jgi:V8-like Glu-specific endopeptidase
VGNAMPRRAATLIAAALLLAALFPSSTAQAGPYRSAKGGSGKPVAKELDPRHKFLASKLTPKAMRAAQPLDLEVRRPQLDLGSFDTAAWSNGPAVSVAPTSASMSAGDIPYTRTEIVNTTDAPNRTHGKIFMYEGSTPTFVCSGTVVNSTSGNVVWTAGHCVHEGSLEDPSGGFFDAYAFVPARRHSANPFGVWFAETAVTTPQWATSTNPDVAFKHDVGALALERVGGQEIVDVVGARGIRFNQSPDQLFDSYGYPAAAPFDGEKLWVCDSDSGILLGSGSLAFMGIGCDMTGGSSGGGWIVDGEFVQSVNSFGIEGDPQYEEIMFGPQMRDAAFDVYELATGEDTVPPKLTRVSDGPDPFTPTGKRKRYTNIKFKIIEKAFIVLTIKNKQGNLVHRIPKAKLDPDFYYTSWRGRNFRTNKVVKAGTYTYKIKATDLAGNPATKSGKVTVKR